MNYISRMHTSTIYSFFFFWILLLNNFLWKKRGGKKGKIMLPDDIFHCTWYCILCLQKSIQNYNQSFIKSIIMISRLKSVIIITVTYRNHGTYLYLQGTQAFTSTAWVNWVNLTHSSFCLNFWRQLKSPSKENRHLQVCSFLSEAKGWGSPSCCSNFILKQLFPHMKEKITGFISLICIFSLPKPFLITPLCAQ